MPSASVERQRGAGPPEPTTGCGPVDLIGHVQVLRLAQREIRANRIDLRHRRQKACWRDEIADLRGGDRRDAVNERPHFREADVQLRGRHGGLGRLDRCLRGQVGLDVVVQLALGNRSGVCERRIPLHVALGAPQFGLGLRELRLHLRERRLERSRIDLEQHLALPDHGAFPIVAFDQIAGHLRPDLRVDVAVQRCDPLARDRDGFGLQRDDRHCWRRGRRRRRFGPATGLNERKCRDGRNEQNECGC